MTACGKAQDLLPKYIMPTSSRSAFSTSAKVVWAFWAWFASIALVFSTVAAEGKAAGHELTVAQSYKRPTETLPVHKQIIQQLCFESEEDDPLHSHNVAPEAIVAPLSDTATLRFTVPRRQSHHRDVRPVFRFDGWPVAGRAPPVSV